MHKYLWLFGIICSLIVLSCIDTNVISPKAQLKADTAIIHSYLRVNGIYDQAEAVPGGSLYIIDSLAIGIYPELSDSIRISYQASIINHDLSLSPVDTNTVTVLLSTVMAGWQTTIPLITAGSKGRLFIPSGQAFGAASYTLSNKTTIQANSNLLYQFDLISSKGTHFQNDTTIISSYLSQQGILPIVDHSGIRYTIDTVGMGTAMPLVTDSIIATFKGNILRADSLFIKDTIATRLSLKNQITAWKIILPKIKEGSFIRMYVPSGYAYGSNSPNSKIPANSNLEYQLKLIKVIH